MSESSAPGRVLVEDVYLHLGDTFHLTPLSDTHIDDALCDLEGLRKMAALRRDLPHHRAIWLGDIHNLVVPTDVKRYRQSTLPEELQGREDWVDGIEDLVAENVESLGFANTLFAPGNHEDEFVKRVGVDMVSRLARRLGSKRGGYSGVIDFRLHCIPRGMDPEKPDTKRRYPYSVFRAVWHHGRWGGGAKGILPATNYFFRTEGWNVALYGHNHGPAVDPELRLVPNPRTGEIEERKVYVVDCGSWVGNHSPNPKITHYAERAAYPRQPRLSPLIRVTPFRDGDALDIDYSVEV